MSQEDKIVDVLSSNEEVVASVESWDLPALSERYRDACVNSNTSESYGLLFISSVGGRGGICMNILLLVMVFCIR